MSTLKTRKKLAKIGELVAMGYSNYDIANSINQEFKDTMTGNQVKRVIQKQAVFKKQLIKTDTEFREIHRQTLFDFISKVNDNTKVLEKIRKVLEKRFNELKKDIPESKLMTFSREIGSLIRTQNDTVRTMNALLQRTETETSELKVSAIDSVQNTLGVLKDLESMGFITIHEDFNKSEMYKEINKNENKETSEVLVSQDTN